MTRVVILGEEESNKKLKPIEFHKVLCCDSTFSNCDGMIDPKAHKVIELISKKYSDSFDVMFAHDGRRQNGILYLGRFNDGVVE